LIDSTIVFNSYPLYKKVKRDNETPGASKQLFEYNLQPSQDLLQVVNGVSCGLEASVLKLHLIVDECISLEFSQGQRIVPFS
jgi:hypothetical protein